MNTKNTRKTVVFLLALAVLLCLTGCKGKNEPASSVNRLDMDALRAAEVGSYIFFGEYEQDNDESTGKEAIEWLVLDKQDDKMLVISKYGLDCQPYNTEDEEVLWDNCSLRTWLNATFYETAFTPEEKKRILDSEVTVDDFFFDYMLDGTMSSPELNSLPGEEEVIIDLNPGKAVPIVSDKVFLLSYEETIQYFADLDARICLKTPFCDAQGARAGDEEKCQWWLRTGGFLAARAAAIYPNGSVYYDGNYVFLDILAVRPAMWISLGASDNSQAKEKKTTETPSESSTELSDLSKIRVGSHIYIGEYEQNNDTSDGRDVIEWIVLDKQEDKLLVISRYGLDCQVYYTEYEDTSWETSTLREWLNSTFYEETFSSIEKRMILDTELKAEPNPEYDTPAGNDTTDRVFVLSIDEANRYFKNDAARMCSATPYSYAQGTWEAENGCCWWWLRTPGYGGYGTNYAAFVDTDGSVATFGYGVSNDNSSVRPAMWISIKP